MYNQQHSLSDTPYTIIEGIENQLSVLNKDLSFSGSLTTIILKYDYVEERIIYYYCLRYVWNELNLYSE